MVGLSSCKQLPPIGNDLGLKFWVIAERFDCTKLSLKINFQIHVHVHVYLTLTDLKTLLGK